MSDIKFIESQGKHGEDFIAFVGEHGEVRLSDGEIVKMLNGFNDTCDSNQELIAKLQADNELLRGLFKPLTYELQACQNVLHSLAHNGQVCWDYSVDAKKVLEATELALAATAKG